MEQAYPKQAELQQLWAERHAAAESRDYDRCRELGEVLDRVFQEALAECRACGLAPWYEKKGSR